MGTAFRYIHARITDGRILDGIRPGYTPRGGLPNTRNAHAKRRIYQTFGRTWFRYGNKGQMDNPLGPFSNIQWMIFLIQEK